MAAGSLPQRLRTLGEIRKGVLGIAGEPAANQTIRDRTDLYINSRFGELIEQKFDFTYRDLELPLIPKEATGTVDVTQGSATVSENATTAFTAAHIGQVFRFDGVDEAHRIAAVASSGSLSFVTPFQASTATNQSYRIITNAYDVPIDYDETVDVWSDRSDRAMEIIPIRQIRRLQIQSPIAEGLPRALSIDYEGNIGRPRFIIWPVVDERQTIHIKYQRKTRPMVKDEEFLKDNQLLDGSTVTSFDNQTNLDGLTHVTFVGERVNAMGTVSITGVGWLGITATESVALNGTDEIISEQAYQSITSITLPTSTDSTGTIAVDIGIDDPPTMPEKSRWLLFWGALSDVYEAQGDDSGRDKAEGRWSLLLAKLQSNLDATRNPLRIAPRERRRSRRPTAARFDLGRAFDNDLF